jgi:hypothetical protein
MLGLKHIIYIVVALNILVLCYIYSSVDPNSTLTSKGLNNWTQAKAKNSIEEYLDDMGYSYKSTLETDSSEVTPSKPHLNGQKVPQQVSVQDVKKQKAKVKQLKQEIASLETNILKYNTSVEDMKSKLSIMNPLRILGGYQSPGPEHFNGYPRARPMYKTNYLGFTKNPSFCDIADMYNLYNPDNIFENMNFIADYSATSLVRKKVMKAIGNDVNPLNSFKMKGKRTPRFDMNINATLYFTKKVNVYNYFEIGRQVGCLSQMFGHIPGNGMLTRKDLNVAMVNNYAKRYQDKPKCFNKKMYFPYSYRLNNKTECTEFFEEINSKAYKKIREKEPIPFILKKGFNAHRARGLAIFDLEKEKSVQALYNNGKKCGQITAPTVAQKYISNPLLLDKKNKFDFRIYMLIASVDPLVVYYHDGFLRVSLQTYDKNSKDPATHFTNTHLSKAIFKKAKQDGEFRGMTESELREYQMWSMERLTKYLYETGKIKEENWLEAYLRPQFKRAFVHTARMVEKYLFKSSNVFEMFGLDFLLDEDLNLWFIECNASPQLVGTNPYKTEFLVKMLKDVFEIEYAYLRSRWTRIQRFMKKYYDHVLKEGTITDVLPWKEELQVAIKNKIEPEFEIKGNLTWEKIIDKNLPGAEAYLGNIEDDCIDDL